MAKATLIIRVGVVVMLAAGCSSPGSHVVGGSAVAGSAGSSPALTSAVAPALTSSLPAVRSCRTVSATLADIPRAAEPEPQMRIPVPQGWERATEMENQTVRFAMRNPQLAVDGFTPNVTVLLTKLDAALQQQLDAEMGRPEKVLKAQNEQLVRKLGLTDVQLTTTEVCGVPALVSRAAIPMTVPARGLKFLRAVYKGRDITYMLSVMVQTTRPENQTLAADSETIIDGFQFLPAP